MRLASRKKSSRHIPTHVPVQEWAVAWTPLADCIGDTFADLMAKRSGGIGAVRLYAVAGSFQPILPRGSGSSRRTNLTSGMPRECPRLTYSLGDRVLQLDIMNRSGMIAREQGDTRETQGDQNASRA